MFTRVGHSSVVRNTLTSRTLTSSTSQESRQTHWRRSFAGHFTVATGGTESTFTVGRKKFKRHVFQGTNGTFTFSLCAAAFRTVYVGGGGGGGAHSDGFSSAPGNRGGGYVSQFRPIIPVGSLSVVVGTGGASGGGVTIGGGNGTAGGQGGNTYLNVWNPDSAGGGGGGGAGPSAGATPNLTGNPRPIADGGFQTIAYTAFGLSSSTGLGGTQAFGAYPGTASTAGTAGGVSIEYEILP